MATLLLGLIAQERILFSGEVRAVMLPASEGDMTFMPGHEPTMVMLNPGIIAATDVQGHWPPRLRAGRVRRDHQHRRVGSGQAALPPEELTRDRLDEEILRLETMREAIGYDRARREADYAISRLEQVKTTRSF
ncbi:F0F1 ATP synthase subunit epsilon [Microvirga sp. 2MCAF35]|uniref:F0F1 ATP synthase subunit epsilon n=1 Tax=Microvirga sp. 2MCAF35 TaxID=3232987 RepID=UPI003F9DA1FA